jgi:hypothetical protein
MINSSILPFENEEKETSLLIGEVERMNCSVTYGGTLSRLIPY